MSELLSCLYAKQCSSNDDVIFCLFTIVVMSDVYLFVIHILITIVHQIESACKHPYNLCHNTILQKGQHKQNYIMSEIEEIIERIQNHKGPKDIILGLEVCNQLRHHN